MEIAPESYPVFQCPPDPQYLKKCNRNSPIKLLFLVSLQEKILPTNFVEYFYKNILK